MWQGSDMTSSAIAAVTGATVPPHISQNQRNDVFVGNLAFGTTEDQLYQAFSDLGRIIKVRMVADETGKPRGFAFIEFEESSAALSAIRNMNDYEINGRRIRVNFSNSSHLESLAGKLGMDLSSQTSSSTTAPFSSTSMPVVRPAVDGTGSYAVAEALKNMTKAESYDIIEKLKAIADSDPDEARKILGAHPQLPEAILFLMSRLDMIQTPISTNAIDLTLASGGVGGTLPGKLPNAMNSAAMVIPPGTGLISNPTLPPATAVMSNNTVPRPIDPRARIDPRAAASTATTMQPSRTDPRMSVARPANSASSTSSTTAGFNVPPPTTIPAGNLTSVQQQQPMFNPYMMPPPLPTTVHPSTMAPTGSTLIATQTAAWSAAAQVLGLDFNLVQQVMALTPPQMGQLPPDKQQSILALRQQITNAMQQQQQSFLQKGL